MSTYEDHRGGPGRPEPVVPAGLSHLLARLAGPPDHWDRPEGDFGPLSHLYRLTRNERELANSMYRLGSKALSRGDLVRAAECLGTASEAGHPGALFRLAVLASRTEPAREDDVRFLLAEAARHGHGDAGRLLAETAGRLSELGAGMPAVEDSDYSGELRQALGLPLPSAGRRATRVALEGALVGPGVAAAGGRGARLVPVPVPGPRLARHDRGARPRPAASAAPSGGNETRQTITPAAPGHITAPVPEPVTGPELQRGPMVRGGLERGQVLPLPPAAAQPGPGGDAGNGEELWSVRALRPARLTGLARNMPASQQRNRQWETVARARELLHLVDTSDGISTRDLTRRTGLSFAAATHLLHWLRGQHLIESIAGEHRSGSRLDLARTPGGEEKLVRVTLDGLCRRLGAAVYYSQYIDGEVRVVTSASGPAAPPVNERVPFPHVAHASAVGKSLLAQLDFRGRMDHLSRYEPFALTDRTITDPTRLFEALDGHGPQACQFDLLEYSDREICAAFPLTMPARAACIALSLPAHQHQRLTQAAHTLSQHSAGILLALLLSDSSATSPPLRPTVAGQPVWNTNSSTALALP
ncbi:IclR family transcriptional regulator domain-containing protein [Streptomyces goshikiensis]|uniref:IclR family transcriptional regulator domain-containing protein n=1 Tax=Streptomyces goshikiensis TaxID=1942 RepID=UPI0036CD873A